MFNHRQFHDVGPSWARQIRALASESHRLVRAEFPDPIEVASLFGRIEEVRRELEIVRHEPGLRWLEALEDELDAQTRNLDDSDVITV